jgi:hypothetical protein
MYSSPVSHSSYDKPKQQKMKTLILLLPLLLTSCGMLGGDDQSTTNRRGRGLSVSQFGLINISSGNTLTAPEPRDDTRIRLDQVTRLQLDDQRGTVRQ